MSKSDAVATFAGETPTADSHWRALIFFGRNVASYKFALGHALGMRSIHGLKTKSDKLDSWKIAQLLRGRNLPCAYVYPRRFRATRDLLHAEATATLRRREVL